MYALEAKGGHTLTFVVIYGWTGGAQDARAAARTSDLIDIVLKELSAQPDGPTLIVGDVNAGVADVPALRLALAETDDDSIHA